MDGESERLTIERRVCDRRQRRQFTLRDQRTGFDRRAADSSAGLARVAQNTLVRLRDRPRVLLALLIVVNVFNVADFGLTLNALANGFTEANPLMRWLLDANPVWAGAVKTLLVMLVSLRVWQCKRYRKALIAAAVMLVFFGALFAWHIYCLTLIG